MFTALSHAWAHNRASDTLSSSLPFNISALEEDGGSERQNEQAVLTCIDVAYGSPAPTVEQIHSCLRNSQLRDPLA